MPDTPPDKPKILYVINHMDWFWSHRLPLAEGARDAGYEVHVAAPGAEKDAALPKHGFYAHALPASPLAAMPALRKILKAESPQVVHAITLKTALFTGLAARLTPKADWGGRLVLTIAGLGYLFSGAGWKPRLLRLGASPFLRFAFRGPNTSLIFQNPDDRDIMIAGGFANPDPERSVLIRGSGVDLNAFSPTQKDEKETAPPLVLMPTRLLEDKGVRVFAQAAKILKAAGIPARFALAGGLSTTNPTALTQADMAVLTASGALEWLGHVRDMPALLAQADLIAYPSWYREGVPKALLEAAACGLPVVTTDHPGCREVVRDGENGRLVPVQDAQALADAIRGLLADPAMRARMGAKSRKIAETEFSVDRVVADTLKVYRKLFKSPFNLNYG